MDNKKKILLKKNINDIKLQNNIKPVNDIKPTIKINVINNINSGITINSINYVKPNIIYEKLEKNINSLYYNKPKTNDLVIGFVFFNVAKSKRLLMNYLYTTNKLKLSNIPYYTLEVVYNKPEIPEAIHIECKSIMFQKERLCYVLEKHIPKKYTKILFLDCDIIFDNPKWYDDISNKLNTYNVVHPFTTAIWLDITYKYIIDKKFTIIQKKDIKSDRSTLFNHHSGFGWAFQREWFNKVGFYEYCILGSGDLRSGLFWLNHQLNDDIKSQVYNLTDDLFSKMEKPIITYIPGNIYHLYHGSEKNRQYISRHKILENINNIVDILIIKENMPFEFKPEYKYINDQIKEHLKNRFDDDI